MTETTFNLQQMLDEIEKLREDLLIQQGCCDGAAAQDASIQRERQEHKAEVERLRSKIKWLMEDDERLYGALYRIANPPPFADDPFSIARNATRGKHLRREALDAIKRALEGSP
jgi:hypothetical protein